MKRGRSEHLIRIIILVIAILAAFIVMSAAIRYDRKSGLFDAHQNKPLKQTRVKAFSNTMLSVRSTTPPHLMN